MTHISTLLSPLSGLQSFTQSPTSLSPASSRAEEDIAKKSVTFQQISAISNEQFAFRNTSDAIAFIQTTDNALFKATSNLLELRLLAQQASTITLTTAQTDSLVAQANSLKSSLNTLASTTVIDGKNILDGSVDQVSFQISGITDQSISIPGFNVNTTALGILPGFRQSVSDRVQLADTVAGTQGIQEGNASTRDINNFSISVTEYKFAERVNIAQNTFGGSIRTVSNTANLTDRTNINFASGLAKSIAERISVIRNSGEDQFDSLTATALTQFKGVDVVSDDFSGTVDDTKGTAIGEGTLSSLDLLINGIDIGSVIVTSNDSSGGLVRAINEKSDISGVYASANANGELVLTAYDGRDIIVSTSSTAVSNTLFGAGENRFSQKFSDLRITGQVTLSNDKSLSFLGADALQTGFDSFNKLTSQSNNTLSTGTIFRADFSSITSAELAIGIIDSALSQVASFRTNLSVTQNKVITLSNDPFSNIRSKEEAEEVADQLSFQVQQQTSSAFISQANTNAQQALLLLS